jgi:hypothetical protein
VSVRSEVRGPGSERLGPGLVAIALALGLLGCPKEDAPQARSGLRVPLPPGWVAEEGKSGSLKAGPRGRTVLLLEHQGEAPLPDEKALEEAVKQEGGELLEVKREAEVALVRYRVGSGAEKAQAFLGARRLDRRLFLCASAPEASEAELRVAEGVCRDLKWGGVGP